MSAIFLSYRRADAEGHAGRLWDRLRLWFDPEALFYDQGRIESGEVFPEEIKQALDAAKVVLVLIAPGWQRILAERAEGPGIDWVRREVEIALERRLQPESRTAASSWRWRPRTAPPFSCAATGCGRSWRGSIRKR